MHYLWPHTLFKRQIKIRIDSHIFIEKHIQTFLFIHPHKSPLEYPRGRQEKDNSYIKIVIYKQKLSSYLGENWHTCEKFLFKIPITL